MQNRAVRITTVDPYGLKQMSRKVMKSHEVCNVAAFLRVSLNSRPHLSNVTDVTIATTLYALQ